MSSPAFTILGLLSQICEKVSADDTLSTSLKTKNDYMSFVQILEWRIKGVQLDFQDSSIDTVSKATLIMRLYQLSMLVYLNRACEVFHKHSTKTQAYVDEAFAIFRRLEACEWQFPVFIIGCEAHTDEQRIIILDLISRTEKKRSSRSFNYVQHLSQAIWAQDDLTAGTSSYWDKLSAIITSCSIVPSFA